MKDPRLDKLAKILIHHSIRLQAKENVLIEVFDLADMTLVRLLLREIKEVGANPVVAIQNQEIIRELCLYGSEKMFRLIADTETYRMKKMQAYIGIRSWLNVNELADVPSKKINLYNSLWRKPVHLDVRVTDTKWVILRYPNHPMAQQAEMSTEAFEDFYFSVCTVDYAKMAEAMKPLKRLMELTDKVHIVGPETDLEFSIKGITVVPCFGERNIPDGEIFTAPVRESVNGYITFNTPSIREGKTFQNIRLEFEKGKIVKATADQTEELNKILDADEGARFTGEFSFGVNPHILKPMKETLFDEKISGSFHLTPGACYEKKANNGNKSSIHWDLVAIQRPEYGGGEIYFDGVLIRKDGLFVLPELQGLNPNNLM